MKAGICVALVAVLVAGLGATARGQLLEIPAFPNPVGSGARAAAMADTFISIADDASAASWNPAGLTQLERPEISLVGAFQHHDDGWDFGDTGAYRFALRSSESSNLSLNYLSAAYPFRAFDRNWVVSLNLQEGYRFDREYRMAYAVETPDYGETSRFAFDQSGSLYALSPALAFRLTPRLSLGAAVNFWMDDVAEGYAWRQARRQRGEDTVFGHYEIRQKDVYRDLFGVNFHLGLRYEATDHLTLGAVLRTPFEASVSHKRVFESSSDNADGMSVTESDDGEIDFPWSIGGGASWRFNDTVTASVDVMRTDWSRFTLSDGMGRRHLITGEDTSRADSDATWSVRSGAEWLLISETVVVPVRCGFAYDPQPSRGSPDTVFLAAAGTGLVWGDRLSLDLAYQFRFGDVDAGRDLGEISIRQHRILLGAVVYF